ncbi:MAG: hypothetical protein RL701_261, partial [Pseudomonadota bacterium]
MVSAIGRGAERTAGNETRGAAPGMVRAMVKVIDKVELAELAYAAVARSIDPAAQLTRVELLTGGISARSTALTIALPQATESVFVVRELSAETLQSDPHAAAHQFGLLRHLYDAGVRVPEPVLCDESRASLPTTFLVMRHIAATPVYAPARPSVYVAQLAAALAELHCKLRPVATALLRDLGIPHAAEHVAAFLAQPSVGPQHRFLDDARARLKAAWPPSARNAECLLHGDYWSGNLLWHGDELVAIIDW